MAAKGWIAKDLAGKSRVSEMTVSRFLRGVRQSPRTAKKLAKALGFSVRRYLVRQMPQGAGEASDRAHTPTEAGSTSVPATTSEEAA